MKTVYIVVDNENVYPNAFTSYKDALDEVKRKYDELHDNEDYEDWRDDEENEVDVEEGNKIGNKRNGDPNITELYIEKGIHIYIRKLSVKSKTSHRKRRHTIGGRYNKNKTKKHI